MSKTSDSQQRTSDDTIKIESLRAFVRQYSDLGLWTGALFWADNVLALNKGQGGNDVWLIAKCMVQKGQWHRAAHAVTSRNLHKTHLLCQQIAVTALLEAKEYQTALQIMIDFSAVNLDHTLDSAIPWNRALAAVYLAKGKALSALERRGAAVKMLTRALQTDVCCYEALDLLLEHHAFTLQQDRELIDGLPMDCQCSPAEVALLRQMYKARIDRYGPDIEEDVPKNEPTEEKPEETIPCEVGLQRIRIHSMDYAAARARRLLHRCEFTACLRLLDRLDPWSCADLRVACLVELKRAPTLFAFAHNLVDKYPNDAVSWFAVGCYYFLIGKNDFARRYLSKATSLERGLGCAWLAYGHSFAADNEHDQAMAAYFKASQLLPGCHLPHLYISVECALSNNSKMAERFIARAAGIDEEVAMTFTRLGHRKPPTDLQGQPLRTPEQDENKDAPMQEESQFDFNLQGLNVTDFMINLDPDVSHEAGAAAFVVHRYVEAEKLFKKALKDVELAYRGAVPERWHALLDNTGHACRKNGKYAEALHYHQRALACRPARGPTYAAMGLCLALMGSTEKAIDVFHSALSRNPDDAFSMTMLTYLIDQFADFGEGDEDIPNFPFPAVKLTFDKGNDSQRKLSETAEDKDKETSERDSENVTVHLDMSMSFD